MISAGSPRAARIAVLAVVAVAACGRDQLSGPARVPASMSAETPVALEAAVGSAIPDGVAVIVRDGDGNPVAGVPVTFTPDAGAGTIARRAARTDGSGIASSGTWTLGKAAGSQRLVARVARLDSIEFVATAAAGVPVAGAAHVLEVPSGTVGTALGALPAVFIRDQYGNPVVGATISFSVASGGGAVTGTSKVTDARGTATVGSWTLGTRAGPQTLRARIANLPDVMLTANAIADRAQVMRLAPGHDEITQVGRALAVAPRLSARDRYDNPVANRTLAVRVAQGGGTVTAPVVTDDSGSASLSAWHMGSAEGLNAVAVELDGLPPLTIYAKAVPESSFDIQFRYLGEIPESQRRSFERAADRWRKVIVGNLPSISANRSSYCGITGSSLNEVIDDLIIFVQIVPIDGVGKVLGSAGPCSIRSASGLPHVGAMRFDTDDVSELEATGRFDAVVLHEIGHVLGIGTLWDVHGLLEGAGGDDPHYTGESGRAGFLAAGGSAYAGLSVPVENSGGSGTRDGHWRESILDIEMMTGFVEATGVRMPLSLTTIGGLEDMGYVVTPWGDDAYTYGSRFQSGINASRARRTGADEQLIEVPFPPPEVVTGTGQRSPISAQVGRAPGRVRRVIDIAPRPVQEVEVRRRP